MSLANYTAEQQLFEQLIHTDDEPNILLFKGESGSGKTHLIEHCLSTAPQIPSTLLKLQNGGDTIPTLFTNMGNTLGWDTLPRFAQKVANYAEADETAPPSNQKMYRHLRSIGQISDLDSRLSRYQQLTDAWFDDIAHLKSPYLLAIDTYEQAPSLFDRWFGSEFMAGVANTPQMRLLVGGQTLPQEQSAWSFCASLQELTGIHEAQEWLKWAESAGYQPPSLELMAGVVLALGGNPSRIIEVIKTQFPKSSGPIKPKSSIAEQRKRLRRNMVELFSLSELKDICFDLDINYEKLPGHDHLNGFVRELLGWVQRNGRLHELIQHLQEERTGRRVVM